MMSLFAHAEVVPNLYECLYSMEHKIRYFEECGKPNSCWFPLISIGYKIYTMEVNDDSNRKESSHTGLEQLEVESIITKCSFLGELSL